MNIRRLTDNMISRIFTHLTSGLADARVLLTPGKKDGCKRPNFRPRLEMLEEKIAPATAYTWTGNSQVNQNWSNPDNWQPAGVPGGADSVTLTGNNPATVDQAFGGSVGQLTIDAGYNQTITLNENLTVTTTTQNNGTIAGNFSYIVPTAGTFDWWRGTFQAQAGSTIAVLQSGATMRINGAMVALNGGQIQNDGTIQWSGAAGVNVLISLVNNASIKNNGSFSTTVAGIYTVGGDGTGPFSNAGAVNVTAGATLDYLIPFSNALTSAVTVQTTGLLNFDQTTTFNDGSSLLGPGAVNVRSNVFVNGNVTFDLSARVLVVNGAIVYTSASSVLTVATGTLDFSNGVAAGPGTIRVKPPAGIIIDGPFLVNGSVITNEGSSDWLAGDVNLNGTINNAIGARFGFAPQGMSTMSGSGVFNNSGRVAKSQPGTTTIQCTFNQSGQLTVSRGLLIFANDWAQPAGGTLTMSRGGLQVDGTFTNNGAILVTNDTGIAASQVVNNGSINMVNNGATTLTIATLPGGGGGNFTQGGTGTLSMEIIDNLTNDRLVVAGTATFGGTLQVSLGNNYVPGGQQALSWSLLAYGQRTGNFTGFFLPQSPGNWGFTLGNTNFTVTWTPAGG